VPTDLIDQLDAAFAQVNGLLFNGHLPSAVPVLGRTRWFQLEIEQRRIVLAAGLQADPPMLITCLISACAWWAARTSIHGGEVDDRMIAAWQREVERIRALTGWDLPEQGAARERWPSLRDASGRWRPPDLRALRRLTRLRQTSKLPVEGRRAA
jgi:hypothetical protein